MLEHNRLAVRVEFLSIHHGAAGGLQIDDADSVRERHNPRMTGDLVLAAAMAAWYGEKKLRSILHLPPMPRAPIETREPTLDELIKLQPMSGPDGGPRI